MKWLNGRTHLTMVRHGQVREWWKMTENAANIQTLKVTLKTLKKAYLVGSNEGYPKPFAQYCLKKCSSYTCLNTCNYFEVLFKGNP